LIPLSELISLADAAALPSTVDPQTLAIINQMDTSIRFPARAPRTSGWSAASCRRSGDG